MSELTMFTVFAIIGTAFWVTIPAYLPNSMAVLFGGGTPMDFGKSMGDGRRVLGKGKTWRGFFGGAFSGSVIGLIQMGLSYPFDHDSYWGFGELPGAIIVVILLATGAMFGDALGSFIKRRLGKESGDPTPILDQYDFLIGAWLLIFLFQPHWFYHTFIDGYQMIGLLAILIITPLLHRAVNIVGYKMGKKDVPW